MSEQPERPPVQIEPDPDLLTTDAYGERKPVRWRKSKALLYLTPNEMEKVATFLGTVQGHAMIQRALAVEENEKRACNKLIGQADEVTYLIMEAITRGPHGRD
jgi:hypothetical protein